MRLKATAVSIMLMCSATAQGQVDEQTGLEAEQVDNTVEQNTGIELEELLVTGSRLEGGAASAPLTVITAEDIETRGVTNIDQLFRQFITNSPSISASNVGTINGNTSDNRGQPINNLSGGNVVNLRGLGVGSTLVLLNGRRIAGEGAGNGDFTDISSIAVNSIDRIEILTAGASAIYGADAVAGVVNIILKKNYTGLTASARLETSNTGASSQRYSLTSGNSWGSGNLTATVSYTNQDPVSARRFGLVTRDFRSQGGRDRRQLTSTRGVFALDPEVSDLVDANDEFARDSLLLPVNSGPVDFDSDVSAFERVARDSLGEVLPISLSPANELTSVTARLTQDINNKYVTQFFADLSYSEREADTTVVAPGIQVDGFDLSFRDFGSPFDRDDIAFNLDLSDAVAAGIIPNNRFEAEGENIAFSSGFTGQLTSKWSWEASASYSENTDFDVSAGTFTSQLAEDLFDPITFEQISSARNEVRADFLTNPAAQQFVRDSFNRMAITSDSLNSGFLGVVRGEFLSDRTSGPLQVSLGVDYREEENETTTIEESITGDSQDFTTADLESLRRVTAVFGELTFPITDSISIDAAARWEDTRNTGVNVSQERALAVFVASGGVDQFDPVAGEISGFDESSTGVSPRLGIAWQVSDALKLRATAGQSFRAPNASEVGASNTVSSANDIFTDPLTGEPLDPIAVPTVSGGNPNLENEVANTLNLGLEYRVDAPGGFLDLTIDYFQIDYEDRIGESEMFLGSTFDGIPLQEPAVIRSDDGSARFIFAGPINFSEQNIAGIDIAINHTYSNEAFSLNSSFSLTHQLEDEIRASIDSMVEDDRGFVEPETRASLISTIGFGNLEVTGFVQYNGSYLQRRFGDIGQEIAPIEIDSFATFDLQVSYLVPDTVKYFNGTTVRVGATNLFDTDPPFLDDFNGFDGSFYDVRRQVFYLDVSKNF